MKLHKPSANDLERGKPLPAETGLSDKAKAQRPAKSGDAKPDNAHSTLDKIYGLIPVLEALRSGRRQIEQITIAENARHERLRELLDIRALLPGPRPHVTQKRMRLLNLSQSESAANRHRWLWVWME